MIADQFGAPTSAELLADVTAHALRSTLREPELGGLYHLAASGETSWHSYACFVLQHAEAAGLRLKVSSQRVGAIASSAYPAAAKRPLNSRLNTAKLETAFALQLPHWQAGVARMLSETLEKSA